MIEVYDKQGNPITSEEWGRILQDDPAYKRVAETTLPNKVRVSTVWLGLNHGWEPGEKLIFETMVFRDGSSDECERYSTLEEALEGHERMVKKVS